MDHRDVFRGGVRIRTAFAAARCPAVWAAITWAASAVFAASPDTVPAAVGRWDEALEATRRTGVPTVLVVGRPGSRESVATWRSLTSPEARAVLAGRAVVAEFDADRLAAQAAGMKLREYPSLVVYSRTPDGGLRHEATHPGSLDAKRLAAWLDDQAAPSFDASSQPALLDPTVEKTIGHRHNQLPTPQQPSPQQPYAPQPAYIQPPAYPPPQPVYAPAPPPSEVVVEREVIVERVAEPEAVREVIVEREAPVTREVVVERAAPAPTTRNVLVVPREAPARRVVERVVERAAPAPVRERVIERAAPVVERVVERAAPAPIRERVVERAAPTVERVVERAAPAVERVVERAAPREVVVERAVEARRPQFVLRQPGFVDRMIGGFGNRLRRRGLPRVEVEVEQQPVYRFAEAAPEAVYEMPREAPAPRVVYQPQPVAPQPTYAPPPPPSIPSPQTP